MLNKSNTVVDLPTYEWNPNPDSEADCGNGEYLVKYNSNYEDTQFWNTYIRRVKLVNGEVLFDLEEVYEDVKDNYEPLGFYLDQHLEPSELVESALRNVIWKLEND